MSDSDLLSAIASILSDTCVGDLNFQEEKIARLLMNNGYLIKKKNAYNEEMYILSFPIHKD